MLAGGLEAFHAGNFGVCRLDSLDHAAIKPVLMATRKFAVHDRLATDQIDSRIETTRRRRITSFDLSPRFYTRNDDRTRSTILLRRDLGFSFEFFRFR